MSKVNITARIPDSLYNEVKKAAKERSGSINGVICQALRLYLIYCSEEETIKRRWVTDLNLEMLESGQTHSWTVEVGETQ